MSFCEWLKKNKLDTIPVPVPPVIPAPVVWKPTTEYQFTSDQIFAEVDKVGIKDHCYMWDSTYWTVSLDDWKRIIADVLADMPKYLAEKFDCDDFSFLAMTRVTEKYELNSLGVVVGTAPIGYHSYNVFVAWEDGKLVPHILEPQTGEIDPIGYTMDVVIFG